MTDGALPEVSVVIPTLCRQRQLIRAVQSALAQTDVRVEVIVVDDGSSGGIQLTDHLAGPEAGTVRLVRRTVTGGAGAARNDGIKVARGEWVAFLDDDDLWSPTKLRSQLRALDDDDAVFAYSGAILVDTRGRIVSEPLLPDPARFAEEIRRGNTMLSGASNIICRTSVIRGLGGFRPDLSYFADWEMWIRLAEAGRAARCDDICVATVDHPSSMTRTGRYDLTRELESLRRHQPGLFLTTVPSEQERLLRLAATCSRARGRPVDAAMGYLRAGVYGSRWANLLRAGVCLLPGAGRGLEGAVRRMAAERRREGTRLLAPRRLALAALTRRPTPAWVLAQLET